MGGVTWIFSARCGIIIVEGIMNINIEKFIKDVKIYYYSTTNGGELDSIKKAHIMKLEDGSTLIEWIFTKFRIGFSFELPHEKSFFYIVANQELKSLSHSETFENQQDLDAAIRTTVNYIIENKDK